MLGGPLARRTLRVLLVASTALPVAGSALASFTTSGAGAGRIATGDLAAPAAPAASAAGTGRVDISWERTFLSGTSTPAEAYVVRRYRGAPSFSTLDGYACGTGSTPISDGAGGGSGAFSCSDSAISSAGPYRYGVTAVYRSWTAASPLSGEVAVSLVGPLDHFSLSAATTAPTAGQPDNLTIVAKDVAGNTVTTFDGDKSVDFAGANPIGTRAPTVTDKDGLPVSFGTPTTITFADGVAGAAAGRNAAMTLYEAQGATITVTDGTHGSNGLAVSVAPDAASRLAFDQQPTDASAGQAIAPDVTVRTFDQFGNRATSAALVTVAPSSGTLSGTLSRSAVAGVATFTGLSMTQPGTYTLSASGSGLTSATSAGFTITPAAASKLVVVSSPLSGVASSSATLGPLTVQRQDQFGNPTTVGGAITVGLASSSTGAARFALSSGGAAVSSASIAGGASGVSVFYGDTKAATPTITASGSGLTPATQQATIGAGAAAKLIMLNCSSPGTTSADCSLTPFGVGNNQALTFNVRIADQFGNAAAPAAPTVITTTSSNSADFPVTAGSPSTVAAPGTDTATITVSHNNANTTATITASASGLASAQLNVKK